MPMTARNTMKDKSSLSGYAREAIDQGMEAKDDLEEMAHTAGRSIRRFLTSGKKEITEAAEVCTSAIRERPVQSSLIALGAGFLLAKLLRR